MSISPKRADREALNKSKASNGSTSSWATLKLKAVKPRDPAALLVEQALTEAVARVRAADPLVRNGEPEGVHRLRTSSRRLRGELRTVRGLVDPEWCEQLEGELKWLSGHLGRVRDLDVLLDRIGKHCPTEDEEASRESWMAEIEPFVRELQERRDREFEELRKALVSDRYRNLIRALESSADHPPLREEAHAPCKSVLPSLARASWKSLEKRGRKLDPSSPDEDFHEVRKRAKRARYVAELVAPALGKAKEEKARRFIELTTRLQDLLGEHQDAMVEIDEIERLRKTVPPTDSLLAVADRMIKRQREVADKMKEKYFGLWKKLDRKKARDWFAKR